MNNNSTSLSVLSRLLICLILGLVASIVFTACTPQDGAKLSDTKWRLVSLNEAGVETPMIDAATITIGFGSDGKVSGSGGCNSYGAPYEVQGNMLSIGEITHTMMACEQEGTGQQEQRYFQALKTADRFELVGDRLTIWYGDGQSTLNWQEER